MPLATPDIMSKSRSSLRRVMNTPSMFETYRSNFPLSGAS